MIGTGSPFYSDVAEPGKRRAALYNITLQFNPTLLCCYSTEVQDGLTAKAALMSPTWE